MLDLATVSDTSSPGFEAANVGKSKPVVSEQSADLLLQLLATDDAFRELFLRDTSAAMVQVGAPAAAAECIRPKALASKEAIAQARNVLREKLTGELSLSIHNIFAMF